MNMQAMDIVNKFCDTEITPVSTPAPADTHPFTSDDKEMGNG